MLSDLENFSEYIGTVIFNS